MAKQFVILGCGRFGSSVAKTLYKLGYEVMIVDIDINKVQEISEFVTHAVQADASDEIALKAIGIRNFDVAVITIGGNMQASIMATLTVKDMGVKTVIAKAQNEMHGKVLAKIGADRVVYPERDMGVRIAHNLISSNILDVIQLMPDYGIVEINALESWQNKSLKELKLPNVYGVNVLAIRTGEETNVTPYAEDIIKLGDKVIILGHNDNLEKIGRLRQEENEEDK